MEQAGNTENNSNNDNKSSVIVLGDVFADLVCHLDGSLPSEAGGDTRLVHPITTMAGGSGLNTCTHLCSLMMAPTTTTTTTTTPSSKSSTYSGGGEGGVSLYTAVNESDPYGTLVCNHAKQHGFDLHNCHPDASNKSTGHCAVLVANGERSFLTHLGVMETFEAKDIDTSQLLSRASSSRQLYVHVAGYYNIPGFWNGQLKTTLQTIRTETDHHQGGDDKKKKKLVTSLLCQYDATEAWDGQLMNLLPLVDYLFCNEVEVQKIAQATKSRQAQQSEQQQQGETMITDGQEDYDESYWTDMATFFCQQSPSTCVIVTLGPKGALALHGGQIMTRQEAPTSVENPLDPTGAGDAFISGFLYGLGLDDHDNGDGDTSTTTITDNTSSSNGGLPIKESVSQALRYGCVVGTSCISKMGASNPAPRGEIEELMKKYAS